MFFFSAVCVLCAFFAGEMLPMSQVVIEQTGEELSMKQEHRYLVHHHKASVESRGLAESKNSVNGIRGPNQSPAYVKSLYAMGFCTGLTAWFVLRSWNTWNRQCQCRFGLGLPSTFVVQRSSLNKTRGREPWLNRRGAPRDSVRVEASALRAM